MLTAANPAWANRTVLGEVLDADGRAVRGARVRAWDSDTGPTDDAMGESRTDAQGRFSIRYGDGHWDPAPHGLTKWRPDIYITVLLPYQSEWVRVYRSKIHDDWKLRNDLRINVTLAERDRWVERKTTFDPVIHGFPFENATRTVCTAPTCRQEHWAGQYMRQVLRFNWALCGGMSLTALRRFKEGIPVEPFSPKLKEELVRAQVETVAVTNWAKFLQWQMKPTQPHIFDQHTIGHSTKEEWPRLHHNIDAGRPVVLGLLRVQSNNPSEVGNNHQVLAIGYRYQELLRAVEIDIYDPNHPFETSTISLNLGIPNNQIHANQYTPSGGTEKVRGFFVVATE